jgi:ABC-type antimicrobial peptide transport system permease subunit
VAKSLSAITTAFGDAFTVGIDDPRLLIGAPLLLGALALFACYIPARRAAKLSRIRNEMSPTW